MTKTVMSARITDQHLTLVNVPLIASGGVDEIRIHFQFCGLWDGCGKTAVFYRDPAEVYHVPIADGSVIVPHEVLTAEGFFYFGVMGTGDNIRTTEVVRLYVTQGALTTPTANHEELTPDIYQQLLAAYGKLDTALAKEKENREAALMREVAARQAEIAVERARINELAAMRGEGTSTSKYSFEADVIKGSAVGSGTSAYIDFFIRNLTLDGGSIHSVYDVLPSTFNPLSVVDFEVTDIDPVTYETVGTSKLLVTLIPSTTGARMPDVQIMNTAEEKHTSDIITQCRAFYPLESIYNAELADIRIGHDGETYPTAGEAVRSQVAGLHDEIADTAQGQTNSLIEALCPPFSVAGSVVRCEAVKGYPINVRSYFGATDDGEHFLPWDDGNLMLTIYGKNLYNRNAYPLVRGRYINTNGKLTGYSASTNYAGTEAYIPVNHLQGKQITLNHPPVEVNGNNPRMAFYTADNEDAMISGAGGNGYTHTVPQNAVYMRFSVPKAYVDGTQIQIELGTMVTNYEAYRAPEVFIANPPMASDFYRGYFDWSTGELYSTHDLDRDQSGELREKAAPLLVATIAPTVIRPGGSSVIHSDSGDTEVSGLANPGALIDILTRRFEAISATAMVPVGGGDL